MIQQVFTDTPHSTVSSNNEFSAESDRDFDLTSTLQFVHEGSAVLFDFSAYVWVKEDNSDIEEERKRITDEIAGFNNLLEAVINAHEAFLVNASEALDRLARLANQSS